MQSINKGILFNGTTPKFEQNIMIPEHYNAKKFAQRVQSEEPEICKQIRAKARGISDEQIHNLAKSSTIPIDDIRAMADWTVPKLKDELKKRGVQISSDIRKFQFLSMMIYAFMLERQTGRIGRIGRTR